MATRRTTSSKVIRRKTQVGGPLNYAIIKARVAVICANAVDVKVYDTDLDSDDGAWRTGAEALASSWYSEALNTATRGARAEFPKVAVIVAEAGKVTIYDGDDPALLMWMVFNQGGVYPATVNALGETSWPLLSITALNGNIVVGTSTGGAPKISFIEDAAIRYFSAGIRTYNGDISTRNDGAGQTATVVSGIVDNVINDVAMTVLSGAPIDPATGIEIPSITVGTDGNGTYLASIIQNDGNVYDIAADVSATCTSVSFDGAKLSVVSSTGTVYVWNDVGAIASDGASPDETYTTSSTPALLGAVSLSAEAKFYGSTSGLSIIVGAMSAFVASNYSTGFMVGDIKAALLSSTFLTSLVGTELVTNGDFPVNVDDWTEFDEFVTLTWDASGAASAVATTSGTGIWQAYATVIGETYVATAESTSASTIHKVRVHDGTDVSGTSLGETADESTPSIFAVTFVAISTITTIYLRNSDSGTILWDNASTRLASEDRSVNGNGIGVHGTITRTAVATGAELVGYSGFSALNKLIQPYNSDFDVGTGDFVAMAWIKFDASGSQFMFDRQDGVSTAATRLNILFDGTNLYCRTGTVLLTVAQSFSNIWELITAVRKDGVLYLYRGTDEIGSVASVVNFNGNNPLLVGGFGEDGAHNPTALSLLRIGATALSAEDIAVIYAAELPLFQENAACTLAGSSDAVTALSHDQDIDALHVCTSDIRSVFKGLRRAYTESDAFTVAVDVSGGVVLGK